MSDQVILKSSYIFEAWVFSHNQLNSAGQLFTPDTVLGMAESFKDKPVLYPAAGATPSENQYIQVARVLRANRNQKGLWLRCAWVKHSDITYAKVVQALKKMIKEELMDIGLTYNLLPEYTEISEDGEVIKAVIPSFMLYPRS